MTPEENKQDPQTPVTPDVPQVETPPPTPVVEVPPAQPVATDDKVWISKEEYTRLQNTPAPVVASGAKPTKSVALFSKLQIASTTIAAIAVIIGLIAVGKPDLTSWMLVPGVVVLLLNGIFVLTDYLASKKPGQVIKSHKGRNIFLLTLAILALASPVIVVGAVIIFFVIVCATGGCRGT